jgi:hypothetical protein
MTLYSKNGSIPKPETDGTPGWVEVPEPPVPGKGEETVWWCPPGWVVRPVEPAPVEGYVWKWSQSETQWVEYQIDPEPPLKLTLLEKVDSKPTVKINGNVSL